MPFQITVEAEKPSKDELTPVDVRAAFGDAIDDLAARARLHVIEAMPAYLDKPTPFTLRGIGVLKSTPGAAEPFAEVDVLPQQARYLRYQGLGGTRVAGDYATTKKGVLIPEPDAPRNAYGNLPRGYVRHMQQQPRVDWIRIYKGQYVCLIRHRGRKMGLLAVIISDAHCRPRQPNYDLVKEALAGPGALCKCSGAVTGVADNRRSALRPIRPSGKLRHLLQSGPSRNSALSSWDTQLPFTLPLPLSSIRTSPSRRSHPSHVAS